MRERRLGAKVSEVPSADWLVMLSDQPFNLRSILRLCVTAMFYVDSILEPRTDGLPREPGPRLAVDNPALS